MGSTTAIHNIANIFQEELFKKALFDVNEGITVNFQLGIGLLVRQSCRGYGMKMNTNKTKVISRNRNAGKIIKAEGKIFERLSDKLSRGLSNAWLEQLFTKKKSSM